MVIIRIMTGTTKLKVRLAALVGGGGEVVKVDVREQPLSEKGPGPEEQ